MSPEQLAEFREKLAARREELLAEGDVELEPVRTDPSEKLDEDAAPLTEMNQVIASRRNKARTAELQQIEAALARMDADPEEFGYCADCEEEIPLARLDVMPWARYCVQCQERRSPARSGRRRHVGDYID